MNVHDAAATPTAHAWRDLASAYRARANQPGADVPRWQLRERGASALARATALAPADSIDDAWHWFDVANTLNELVAIADAPLGLQAEPRAGETAKRRGMAAGKRATSS
jgi:hypothetical protein